MKNINNSPSITPPQTLDFWLVMIRALIRRCPNCGEGKLFRGYLKQIDTCACCHMPFAHLRADDGPAWLTILLVGHIVGPLLLAYVPSSPWPDWVSVLFWPSLAFIIALMILPYAKGLFLGAAWRMQYTKPKQSS